LRRNCLLKQVKEGKKEVGGGGLKFQEDEKEEVGSYWMTLRKEEDIVI